MEREDVLLCLQTPPLDPVLRRMNSVRTLPFYFFKIHYSESELRFSSYSKFQT